MNSPAAMRNEEQAPLARGWVFALGAMLIVFSAKLAVIGQAGVNVPFLDQWVGELPILAKWHAGTLSVGDLFAHHNEHLIVTFRLLSLVLYWLNGGWSILLELVVNAAIHAAGWGVLAWALARGLPARMGLLVIVGAAVLGSVPASASNMLWGFQSTIYLCLLFQFAALYLVVRHPELKAGWWAGVAMGVLACFSLSSGLLAFAAALGVLVVRRGMEYRENKTMPERRVWIGGAIFLGVIVGFALWTPHVADHEKYQAATVGQFFEALGRLLAFPLIDAPWFALVLWLPCAALGYAALFGKKRLGEGEWILLAMAVFVLLNALATAYARASFGPVGRLRDIVAPGLLVNFAILLHLAGAHGASVPRRAMAAAWCLVAGAGLTWMVPIGMREVRQQAALTGAMSQNLAGYLQSGDATWLSSRGPVPYSLNPAMMKEMADDASYRAVLPLPFQPPVSMLLTREESSGGEDSPPALKRYTFSCVPPAGRQDFALTVNSFTRDEHAKLVVKTGDEERDFPILAIRGTDFRYYFSSPEPQFDLVLTLPAHLPREIVAFGAPELADRTTRGVEWMLHYWAGFLVLGLGVWGGAMTRESRE